MSNLPKEQWQLDLEDKAINQPRRLSGVRQWQEYQQGKGTPFSMNALSMDQDLALAVTNHPPGGGSALQQASLGGAAPSMPPIQEGSMGLEGLLAGLASANPGMGFSPGQIEADPMSDKYLSRLQELSADQPNKDKPDASRLDMNVLSMCASMRREMDTRLKDLSERMSSMEASHRALTDKSGREIVELHEKLQQLAQEEEELGLQLGEIDGDQPTGNSVAPPGKDFYVFEDTVWDAALFIGVSHLGMWGSLWVTLLTIITATMQLILAFMINDSSTSPSFDSNTVEEMRKWRTFVGHSFDYVDKTTFEPLARMICTHDSSIPMSSGVAGMLETLSGYAPTEYDRSMETPFMGYLLPVMDVGSLMSLVAITIWLLSVATDLRSCENCARGIHKLPNSEKGIWEEKGVVVYWKSIGCFRIAGCGVLLVIRFCITALLGWVGVLFIAHTVTVQDILLNTLALKLILDLPHIVFTAWIPSQSGWLLKRMKPLPFNYTGFAGMNGRPIRMMFVTFAIVVVAAIMILNPQSDDMKLVREEICGGNQDFVSFVDPSGIVRTYVPDKYDAASVTYISAAVGQAVSVEPIDMHNGERFKYFLDYKQSFAPTDGVAGGAQSMLAISKMDRHLVIDGWNSVCLDMLSAEGRLVMNYTIAFKDVLQAALSKEGFKDDLKWCTQVKAHCNKETMAGLRARQICPVTCGCADPESGLVVAGAHMGCPLSCKVSASYTNALKARPCQDLGTNHQYWQDYLKSLSERKSGWEAGYHPKSDLDRISAGIQAERCGVASRSDPFGRLSDPLHDMCEMSPSWYLEPLLYACPKTCRCDRHFREGCPTQCER